MSLKKINVNDSIVTNVDDEPIAGSDNLVKSGGVREQIKLIETIVPNRVKYSNHYITTNTGALIEYEGYFVSEKFLLKAGQTISIHVKGGSGDYTILAECNEAQTEFTILLTAGPGVKNVVRKYYAETDKLVCLSGANGGISAIIDTLDKVPQKNSINPATSGALFEVAQGEQYPVTIKYDDMYIGSTGKRIDSAAGYFVSDAIPVKKGNIVTVAITGYSGSGAVLAKCSDTTVTAPLDVLLKFVINHQGDGLIQNGIPNQVIIEEDCYIVVSGVVGNTSLNVVRCLAKDSMEKDSKALLTAGAAFELKKKTILSNIAANDVDFTSDKWHNVQITRTNSDGIAHCVINQDADRNSRLRYLYAFEKDHIYFACVNVRTNNLKEAKLWIDSYSEAINLYKGNNWSQLFGLFKVTNNNVAELSVMINDNWNNTYLSENDRKYDVMRPIIIDVTEVEKSSYEGKYIGPYTLVTKYDNTYITSTGENFAGATDYFISEAIPVKKGDIIEVTVSGLSGSLTVIGKCNSDVTAPVERLLWFNNNHTGDKLVVNNVPTKITIEEDGYIAVSGIKEQASIRFLDSVAEVNAYKYLKVVNNWDDITKETEYYKDYNSQKLYSYVIAGCNSALKKNADIICTGENDQDIINRVINLPNCESIYFTDDSVFNITSPLYVKSNLKLVSKGAKFFMCDMITKTFTPDANYPTKLFTVDDVSDYSIGMLLYLNNDHQYNKVKKIWPSTKQLELEIFHDYGENDFIAKTASNAIFIYYQHDVVVDGIHIDLNVENNPIQRANPWYLQEGIQIAYSERVWVQNCKIVNGGRRGICTTSAKYFWLLNNYFDNWHEHSIDIFTDINESSLNPIFSYGVISGNICLNNQMSGIQCHRGSGCTIVNNTIKNCPHGGIRNQEHARNNTITGNVIEGCNNGLYLGGHDIVATGNVIRNCNIGVLLGEYSDRISVSGNEIYMSHKSAIRFHSARHCKVSDNLIVNSCLDMEASSTVTEEISIVSQTKTSSSVYDVENSHNMVIGNTFIEYARELLPKHIFENKEVGKKDVFMRNLSIIEGTIETPYVYDTSDIVKDNDIIS